jgi:hypothetical protein
MMKIVNFAKFGQKFDEILFPGSNTITWEWEGHMLCVFGILRRGLLLTSQKIINYYGN